MKIAVLDIGGTSIKSGEFTEGRLYNIRETDTNAQGRCLGNGKSNGDTGSIPGV